MSKLQYLLLLFLGLSACKVDLPEEAFEPKDPTTFNEIVVPDDFTFEMDQFVNITLITKDTNGIVRPHIPVWIYDLEPRDGGLLLAKGESDDEGYLTVRLQLKPDQTAVKGFTTDLSFNYVQNIVIGSDDFIFEWGSDDTTEPAIELQNLLESAYGGGSATCPIKFYQVIGNTLKALNVIDGSYTPLGSASENYNGIGLDLNNGKVYGIRKNGNNNHLWFVDKTNGQETDLGAIPGMTGSGYNYKSDFDPNGNLTIINKVNGNWGLYKIDVYANPITFTVVSLTETNGSVDGVHDLAYNSFFDKYYSMSQSSQFLEIDENAGTIKILGEYSSTTTSSGAFGAVWCDANGYVYCSRNSDGKIYFTELYTNGEVKLFKYLFTGESTSNNDGASCPEAAPPFDLITDSDDDGVPDLLDEAPNDPNIGPTNQGFTPSLGDQGTYAFEDLWPKLGDYDFNDLVVGYNYTYNKNGGGLVVSVQCDYTVLGVGASQQIGFGVSFEGLSNSDVTSVAGTDALSVNKGANGIESGQTKAVVIMFDNAHERLGYPTGRLINTQIGGTSAATSNISVTVNLTTPKTEEQIGEVNPFIYVGGDRGHEVHFMDFPPTDLANVSLFGTSNDASNPGQGSYYRDISGFPWAMNFPTTFKHPTERTNILSAYPKFGLWVNSSGGNNRDWYIEQNAVTSKIYQ